MRNVLLGIFLAVMISVLAGAASPAATSPYGRLVVFGDSLSDTGNAGRFSNGPVWVEYLARALGGSVSPVRNGGTNFAVGGARTNGGAFSLREQANQFLSRNAYRVDGEDTLFIVYGGANDLRGAHFAPDQMAVVDAAIDTLRSIIADIIAAGGTNILVPNIPDIGLTPEARGYGPDWTRAAHDLTIAFNQRLVSALDEVEARHSVRIVRLDFYGLSEQATRNPVRFGFRNMTDPCPYASTAPERCNEYVFWDSVHPSTAGHARMAEAAVAVLRGAASPPTL